MTFSINGGPGAVSLLNTALNGAKPGEFRPKSSAVTNIQSTLAQSDVNANNRLIMGSALNRLAGIREGLIEPNQDAEWEVVGAFLQATGQPFQLKIDERGQLAVEAQADGILSDFNNAQKLGIANAIQQFDKIAVQVDEENSRAGFLKTYEQAGIRLLALEQFFPVEDQWERDFQLYRDMGRPVQVGLNGSGEIVAINQLEHDFAEVEDVGDRLKLLAARDRLKNILEGKVAATEPWETLALGNKVEGDDYLIVLDENGEIAIKNNLQRETASANRTLDHLIPQFLKDDFEVEAAEGWQLDAANLYRQGKAFYFDFDNTGRNIVTREIDLIHSLNLHKPVDRTQDIINAQLSILL